MHLAASRCRARVKRQRRKLLDEARAVEAAGAFAVALERVPKALAKKIVTESISIPTIGIGAGADCDGQVLSGYACHVCKHQAEICKAVCTVGKRNE